MSISEMMVLKAWEKAGGRCECARFSHNHTYVRCARLLKWEMKGQSSLGGWMPSFHNSLSSGAPLSCEILCTKCYQQFQASEPRR